MHIIDTIKRRIGFGYAPVIFLAILLLLFTGCSKAKDENQAQGYSNISQQYYQQAIAAYKSLIAQGKDLDRFYFELGKLYFGHGDYENAILQLKRSAAKKAKKYLAISYYHAANFSEALDIFSKDGFLDDECRYYYGLTAEKLNLFDTALSAYKKINSGGFKELANIRINLIEKQPGLANIKEISPQISRIISQTHNEISDMIRQSYETRQAAEDRISKNFSQYIRGVDEYHNPIENRPVELPSGYRQAWANAQGEYIVSDDVNFNPNLGSTVNWEKLEKKE